MIQGLDVQQRDFDDSTTRSYLMGDWRSDGWYAYYLVGLIVKTPTALVIATALALLHTLLRVCCWKKKERWHPSQDRCLLAILATALLTAISIKTGFNHHVRYAIPAVPSLIILLGAWQPRRLGRFHVGTMIWLVLCGQVIEIGCAAPNWLGFFNGISGGTRNGTYWLTDSNIDWGQDLRRLSEWQRQNASRQPLYLCVFTSLDPKSMDLQGEAMSNLVVEGAALEGPLRLDRLAPQSPGYYAVSHSVAQGRRWHWFDSDGRPHAAIWDHRRLRDLEPIDTVGSSIGIYRVP